MSKKFKITSIPFLLFFFFLAGFAPESFGQPPKPAMFIFSDMDIGSSAYVNYQALGTGILKKYGIKLRILPFTGTEASVLSVLTGVSMSFTTNPGMLYVQEGLYEYGTRELGPKPVRMIYQCYRFSGAGLFTRKDSGMKKATDLKGKRIPYYLGNPGMQTYVDIVLAFAGFTWKDVTRVDVSGLKDAFEGIKAGKIDACMSAATTSGAYEVASSPGGIQWVPMPKEDLEGWKRAKELSPVFSPYLVEKGAGITKENPVWLATNHYPILCGLASLPDDTAYWIVKSIVESYDLYKDIIPGVMEGWTLENALGKGMAHVIPWHNGSVRYFKERGVWKDEYEQYQRKNIERQQKLSKAWEEAEKEAEEKKIKAKDWNNFWFGKRKTIQ